MAKEIQVFGIPGGGKTTYLTKIIKASAEKNDGKGDHLLVSSFTKTAAAELVDRDLPVPQQNVGTLHALCYRLIGRGELAEKHVGDFNKEYPQFALSKNISVDVSESQPDMKYGCENDGLFNHMQRIRAKLKPFPWPDQRVEMMYNKWTEWKEGNGLLDFTDMIDIALKNEVAPPDGVRVGIFDEVQDFTPMQMALVRMWGEKYLDYIMICGDDDQAVFSFTGATPDTFLNPGYALHDKKYLDQSYRVPRLPLEAADRWVKKLSKREPKEPKPRVENGEVVEGKLETLEFNFEQPKWVADAIEELLKKGTVMVLGACGYMLAPVIGELRARGIPFANRFRRSFGAWNPLGNGRGVSGAKRLWNYLTPMGGMVGDQKVWHPDQVVMWADLCEAKKLFVRGKKASFLESCKADGLSVDGLVELILDSFQPEHIDPAFLLKPMWLWQQMIKDKAEKMAFPMAILKRMGKDALIDEPDVTIGTVHSVKGGQADYVILFPDISMNSALSAQPTPGNPHAGVEGRDAIIRQFYVGMTRCREGLYVTRPKGNLYAPILG